MALVPTGVTAKWVTGAANDSTDIQGTSLIRADGAGTLVVKTVGNDTAVTFTVSAGEVIQGQFTRLMAASTATGVTLGRFGGGGRGGSGYLTMAAADYDFTITSDSLSRSFRLHLPPLLRRNAGVVIAYHGGAGVNTSFQSSIGLDALADAATRRFITVYPQSYGDNWTDGRASTVGGADDILFTQDLIAWLVSNYSVDADKVFVTGMSNGGIFCHWLAYNEPTVIAGMATVAANIPASYSASITAQGPRMTVHGVSDPLQLYAGGISGLPGSEDMTGAADVIDLYGVANGGTTGVYTNSGLMPDTDPLDGCRWATWTYTGTAYTTIHYRVVGGGHTWPGGPGTGGGVGNKCTEFSASGVMTAMFQTYGL